MKTSYKKLSLALMAIGFFALFASDAVAQNFENSTSTGVYNATCSGVIRMKAATGTITGVGADLIGTAAKPIPGVVDWAAAAPTQTVQAYYYERLVLSGAAKNVLTGVFVVGDACPTPLAGYPQLSTYPFYSTTTAGDLTFNGTFNYTGGTQTIFPTDVLDPYVTLNVTSTATFPTGTDVYANNVTATGATTVAGDLNLSGPLASTLTNTVGLTGGSIITGTGTVGFSGAVTVDGTSDITVNGAGDVTFTSTLTLDGDLIANNGAVGGLGTVNIDGAATIGATTGTVDLGPGSNLTITGSLANNGDGTNLLFNCGSNVTYDGGVQTIMPTIDADGNRYGNLVLSGAGLKTGGTAAGYTAPKSDINICNDFNLAGGNLTMLTNSGTLKMNNPDGVVTYTANEEVVGLMSRVTDLTAKDYTFNNAATIVSLLANAQDPTRITMDVRPSTAPNDFLATKDVNRKINFTYPGYAGTGFEWKLRAGYLLAEAPTGGFVLPNTQASIRFYEASTAPAREKVGTSELYARADAVGTNLGYVELAGIENGTGALPNDIEKFASGNDFVLSAGPTTFYSVKDGRWTNPNTWDEGTVPTSIDNAEIRTLVFAGIDAPFAGISDGTTVDEVATNNTKSELGHYGAGISAANSILVANIAGSAFILGNEDNGLGYLFKTAQATGTPFANNNTNAMLPAFGTGIGAKNTTTNPGYNGVWITPYGANTSILSTLQISNTGTLNNEGIMEVGQ